MNYTVMFGPRGSQDFDNRADAEKFAAEKRKQRIPREWGVVVVENLTEAEWKECYEAGVSDGMAGRPPEENFDNPLAPRTAEERKVWEIGFSDGCRLQAMSEESCEMTPAARAAMGVPRMGR